MGTHHIRGHIARGLIRIMWHTRSLLVCVAVSRRNRFLYEVAIAIFMAEPS